MISNMGTVSEQAAAALSVLLYVGPVAVYALWLGLVNSQATPKVITARDDFVSMTVAFCPFVVAPIVGLAHAGYGWASIAAAGLMFLLFLRLLPARHSGWVIHNVSPRRARTLVDRTLRSLGWRANGDRGGEGPVGRDQLRLAASERGVSRAPHRCEPSRFRRGGLANRAVLPASPGRRAAIARGLLPPDGRRLSVDPASMDVVTP